MSVIGKAADDRRFRREIGQIGDELDAILDKLDKPLSEAAIQQLLNATLQPFRFLFSAVPRNGFFKKR
jgi:hypothetical protein